MQRRFDSAVGDLEVDALLEHSIVGQNFRRAKRGAVGACRFIPEQLIERRRKFLGRRIESLGVVRSADLLGQIRAVGQGAVDEGVVRGAFAGGIAHGIVPCDPFPRPDETARRAALQKPAEQTVEIRPELANEFLVSGAFVVFANPLDPIAGPILHQGVNVPQVAASAGTDHPAVLLAHGDAPQHVFEQAGIAPDFAAVGSRARPSSRGRRRTSADRNPSTPIARGRRNPQRRLRSKVRAIWP